MNKIIIGNKITCDSNNIKIADNSIIFLESGEYVIEYIKSGIYNIIFEINSDVKIIETSFDNNLVINNNYIVNGKLEVIKFYNNLECNEKINIDLCSKMSQVNYIFANICRCQELYEININHKFKDTISNINNKSIALDKSRLKFIINSNVGNDCNGSILNQNTRIVTFGESDAEISPNMYIDLDDIEARHGSIIGTFKDDQIFYLMSKGISYYNSLKLLIKGYLLTNLDVHDEIKGKITEIIDTYWR